MAIDQRELNTAALAAQGVSLDPLTESSMVLNMGPQHPSTHGVLRIVLELDGETIVSAVPHMGYVHTGIEKEGEYQQYLKAVTITDSRGIINATGMEIDNKARTIKLQSRVSGRLQPQK